MLQSISAVRFDPTVPLWVLGVLAALCVLAAGPALWRRARGGVLRLLCFAVVLLWLAGPRLVQETREALNDIAVMVVDRTGSMAVGNRAALVDEAAAKLQAEAAQMPGMELRTVTVPESGHDGTRLFSALDRTLADIPRSRLAGVMMLTDGEVHDIPKAAPSVPLHVLVPASGEQTDRRIRIIEAPSYGIVGKSVRLRLAVDDLGVDHAGQSAPLTIQRDGEAPRVVQVPVGTEQSIEIPITRAGPTVVELAAAPMPGEVSDLNNHAVVSINGVRDRLRVLLVSGEPHAGERTWRRLLKADPSVDLVHFTILRPPEKDDMTPLNELALIAFPVRELFQVKIKEFDLIILDRFSNRGILPPPYLRNIADYVRQGGALLLSVGPEFSGPGSLAYSPLAPVLPAEPLSGNASTIEAPFRPQVTALGERHPVTAGLPGDKPGGTPAWGEWYRRLVPNTTRGQAVMSGPDGQPLLLLDRVGEGRAALLLSDQIWLWSREHEGGGPQAELLRRVAHWLMKEPALEEEALTASVDGGTLSIERRTTSDAPPPPVTATSPGGQATTLTLKPTAPGRATVTLAAPDPGVWRVSDGTRTAFAAAGSSNPLEIADLRATGTYLADITRASSGSVHWLEPSGAPELRSVEPDRVTSGASWIGLRRNHDHLVTGVNAIPLLPAWAALPLLLGLAFAAWRRESVA
ncbi:hypothetical protein [Acidisphaera sp. L21]|uniref:hypothetical protein n=1 Tax=Acidisphaera sp. L21 TaxID=1641851 RepID=UPI00131DFA38|nr:hypothetical protein [Acidisphaera sp. L21]